MLRKANISYKTVLCSALTNDQLQQCATLFSENYGTYSGKDNESKKGKRIVLKAGYYAKFAQNENMWVSLAYSDDLLIGQCFFLRKELEDGKVCTWVTQLLVHRFYRGRHIATNLLQSAWGFSNYYAWGLATANTVTIKTLEAVTWRRVSPDVIADNLDVIERLCNDVEFADASRIELGDNKSQIYTRFYPEHDKQKYPVYVERLGALKDGYEWLAFTFNTQDMFYTEERMAQLLAVSAEQLNEAYSRMDMRNQPWTRHTAKEIDYIEKACELHGAARILDVGCGFGRHSIELARRQYDVVGVDLSETLISQARENVGDLSVTFDVRDCRNLSYHGTFDTIICLYDVIGSYRTYEENENIVKGIYKKLKKGGVAVVSVMNMDLTKSIATVKGSVSSNPGILLKLKASNIMQATGNVFNPDYFILDEQAHLVYRKEQFERDDLLSSEYLVADYRFTKSEIEAMLMDNGFSIVDSRYVQAGNWDVPLSATDKNAKEILLVVKKE